MRKDGKRPKKPYSPHSFGAASVTDPATWGSFDQAVAALAARPGYFDGYGYVFAESDPFTGVDLDGCIEAGHLASWAKQILDQLPGAYVELSVSGTGIHAMVRAQLPGHGRRRGQVECYDRDRFFVVTGRAFAEPGPIASAQAAIDALYTDLFGHASATDAAPVPAAALDWGFVAWLEARMRRLIGPDGLPYGATPQLRDLLLRGQLPNGLTTGKVGADGSDSARRAVVVAQLARAGRLPEETYLLARHLWARCGYESNKRPVDLANDALRLLATYPVDPARYSAHSLARFQEYRNGPQQAPAAAPAALQRPQTARRAVCTPDAYLVALSGLDTGAGLVIATRAERAAAIGVSLATAERIERKLQAAGRVRVEVYRLAASDGRRTRASKIMLIPVSASPAVGADADTGISMSAADADTIIQETAQGVDTPQSGIMSDKTGVCIGEYTGCDLPPTPGAPAAAAAAPPADNQAPPPPVSPPCPAPAPATAEIPQLAPRPIAELVSEAIDAYGTTGGNAARRRVITHVRTVGGLAASEGAIIRVYLAELERRKRARADAALRHTAETMSPAKRRARLRSLEHSIIADLKLAADLRIRPNLLDPLTGDDSGERRSAMTPAKLTARAWVWAKQYAIIALVHEERTQNSAAFEEATLLTEANAVLERLRTAGELPAHKPRARFKSVNFMDLPPTAATAEIPQLSERPAPAPQMHQVDAFKTYDVAAMVRRLAARNHQLASCAD